MIAAMGSAAPISPAYDSGALCATLMQVKFDDARLVSNGASLFTEDCVMNSTRSLVATLAFTLFLAAPAFAQQGAPPPGSPSATRAIDGKQLPPPDMKFGGANKRRLFSGGGELVSHSVRK